MVSTNSATLLAQSMKKHVLVLMKQLQQQEKKTQNEMVISDTQYCTGCLFIDMVDLRDAIPVIGSIIYL